MTTTSPSGAKAPQPVRFTHICPVFLVDDIVKSAEYYRDVLGFQFERYWGEPPCFCMVRRGETEIFLSGPEQPGGKQMRPNRSHTEAWDAYFRVSDARALCAEFRSKGANIVREPCDTFYEMREFEVEDCNGYALCFGQDISPDTAPVLNLVAQEIDKRKKDG